MSQAGCVVPGAAAVPSLSTAIAVVEGNSDSIHHQDTGASRDINVSGEVSVARTTRASKDAYVVSSGTVPTTTTTVDAIGGSTDGGSAGGGVDESSADSLHMESLLQGINSQLNLNLDGGPTAKEFKVDGDNRGNSDGRHVGATKSAVGGGGDGRHGGAAASGTGSQSSLLWGSHSSSSSASPTWGIIGETGNFSSVSSSLGGSGSGGGSSGGGSLSGGSRSVSVGSGLNHLLVQPNATPPPSGTSGVGGAFVGSDGVFAAATAVAAGNDSSTIVGSSGSGSAIPSLASISSSSVSSSANSAGRGAKFGNAWMPTTSSSHGISGSKDTIGISHVAIRQGTHPQQQHGHQRGRNANNLHAQSHAIESNDVNSYPRIPQHSGSTSFQYQEQQQQQQQQHRRQQRPPHHEHQQQPPLNLQFSNAATTLAGEERYDEQQLLYAAQQSPQVPMQMYGMPYLQGQPSDWMDPQQQQQQQFRQEDMMYNPALYSVQGDGSALEYGGHSSLVSYAAVTSRHNNSDLGCFTEVHVDKNDSNAIPVESLSYADVSRTGDGGNRNGGIANVGRLGGSGQSQHNALGNPSPRTSRKVHPMPTPPSSTVKGGLSIGGHPQSQQHSHQQYTPPLPPMQKQLQLQHIVGQLPPRQRQQQLREQKREEELLKFQSLHNQAIGRNGAASNYASADSFSSMNCYRHQLQEPSPSVLLQNQFGASSAAIMAMGISDQEQGGMLQMTNIGVANSNSGGVVIPNYCGVSAPMGQLAVESDVVASPGHAIGLPHCASDPSLSTIAVEGTSLAAAAHNRLYHRSESSSPINSGSKSVSGGRYTIGGIEAPGMTDPQGNSNTTVKLVTSRQQQLTTVLTSSAPQQQQQRQQQPLQHPPLSQLVGNIRRLSRDQVGCRLLQHSLQEEGPEAATAILNELLPNLGDLMMDPFGNYLFQKLLDCLSSEEERVLLVRSVSPKLVAAALNLHGTRSVQKMVDVASSDEEAAAGYKLAALVSGALQPAAARLCIDSHGNHVIQRILLGFPPRHAEFVFRCVARNVSEVARHRHGCCVIQRCLDAGLREMEEAAALAAPPLLSEARDSNNEGGQQEKGDQGPGRENPMVKARSLLINKICEGALELMQDAYGNYVVQYVLDVCVDAPNYASIVNSICRVTIHRVAKLSIQKFSSNVVEKCLERCSEQMRELLLKELMHPRTIATVMQDPFGNYVVQRALSVATHAQAVRLVESMKPHLVVNVRNTAGGRRIMEKIVKRFPNFSLDGDGALIVNGNGCGVGSMGGVGGSERQRKVSSSNYLETKVKNQGMATEER